MLKRLVFSTLIAWLAWAPGGSWLGLTAQAAQTEPPAQSTVVIDRVLASNPDGSAASIPVALPDDWAGSRPRFDGAVWYRAAFDRPAGAESQTLMALSVDRACSAMAVRLNGVLIHSAGPTAPPQTRNCAYPQLVPLPLALLQANGNQIELQLQGHALQQVTTRERAGGLSTLKIGPLALLEPAHASMLFWRVTAVQIAGAAVAVLGLLGLALYALNRREAYLAYFGWLALGWSLLSVRIWWRDPPWDDAWTEGAACFGFAVLLGLTVQFLLSYANLRSRWIEKALVIQTVIVPLTLGLAGAGRLFAMASLWYPLFALELLAAIGLHLIVTWRDRRAQFAPVAGLLAAGVAVLLVGQAVHYGLIEPPQVPLSALAAPLMFAAFAARLLRGFAHSIRNAATDAGRELFDNRVAQVTAEIEQNFAQLADLRVEQVTEKERKRIAGDLHDDLGAKLLTIVHTSESERISTLARDALEEMRLSVRGLTGKPMRLADALADWRAETVQRLGQANIEADWRNPAEETEQLLPARGFVQTTRILRECVSNIIKHSGASHCKVRCSISDRQFGLTVQDNGKGIPMELDGKLDRGHGMTSMKHRAKQMQGQCLVESGPGYGTVIRLTLPL